jgi:hypothetical protein
VAHHLGDISRQRLGLFLFTRLLASARSLVFVGNMAKRKARGVPDLELRASRRDGARAIESHIGYLRQIEAPISFARQQSEGPSRPCASYQ